MFDEYFERLVLWGSTSGLKILLVLVVAIIGIRAAKLGSAKLATVLSWRHDQNAEIKKRAQTLAGFARYLALGIIFIVGTMMILQEIGIEIRPILAGAGIVGLAVGFGAQNLVQDIISGFFILLEDQIRVGDVVNIKGKGGLVEKIGLRMIVLRDFDGTAHYIRNGQIDIVSNATKNVSNFVFEVRVSYRQDVEQVVRVLKEIDEEMRKDPKFETIILKPLEVYPIDGFDASSVVIKARTTTVPIRQWDVGREFNRRMKKRFDAEGIIMPYPQLTVSFGPGKEERAEPLRVMVENLRGAADGQGEGEARKSF